jgi:hypothetical protein
MTTSQQLVIYWMEFALAGAIVLGATKVVVHRLRQPIDRVNLIFMSVVACVLVPLLFSSLSTPGFQLGIFSIDGNQQKRVVAQSHSSPPRPHFGTTDVSVLQTNQQTNTEAHEALASESQIRSDAFSVVDGERQVDLPARANESASRGMIDRPTVWSIVAAVLLVTHGMVFSWCLVQWIIGTVRLRNISKRAVGADQSIFDLWNEISGKRGDRKSVV